jgi:hypothetical protein
MSLLFSIAATTCLRNSGFGLSPILSTPHPWALKRAGGYSRHSTYPCALSLGPVEGLLLLFSAYQGALVQTVLGRTA